MPRVHLRNRAQQFEDPLAEFGWQGLAQAKGAILRERTLRPIA